MNRFVSGAVLCVAACSTTALAHQLQQSDTFSRKNTFSIFAEFSPTSSHILLGAARQRILTDLGGAYTRRIVSFHGSDIGYRVEIRPVLFESDPIQTISNVAINLAIKGCPITRVRVSAQAGGAFQQRGSTHSALIRPPMCLIEVTAVVRELQNGLIPLLILKRGQS
jgi:hypothetical protein